MSFLANLFKKKDAAYHLDQAKKAIDRKLWLDAIHHAEDGSSKSPDDAQARELEQALRTAQRGLCDLNREEAEFSAEAGELERAIDLLNVAMNYAPSESVRKDLRREVDRIERRAVSRERSRAAEGAARGRTIGAQNFQPIVEQEAEEQRSDLGDLFEVYLAGLVPEVAEHYRALGTAFAEGYVSLNEGDAKTAIARFREVKAEGAAQAYLDFERARIALSVGAIREARTLLERVVASHGYGPIYTSGSPSVALLEAEARIAEEDIPGALLSVRKGLELDPENANLLVLEVQLLTREKAWDDAISRIELQVRKQPKFREMYLLYHQLEMSRGDEAAAAAALERGMQRCCASGQCGAQDRDIPRTLINHYLERSEKPKRVNELLNILFLGQGGEGEWIDHYLRAKYFHWQGDRERAVSNSERALKECPPNDPRVQELRALLAG